MLRSIIKSNNDARIYKSVLLSNQLNCLLISDKNTDKSAASLNVHVGQASDPVERPGLAHFLEHMLFLGTEKYPNQNDYSSYITANSGSNNAYTAMCNTNYFFDCSNNAFHGALDRFAQFFITPLFTESCTDREINAVQSEHEKNLMSDMWRQMQLFRNSSHAGHAYNKFGTGNKDTLHHEGTRNDLLSFYKRYYSSNIMKLVIYGKEDVNILEEWAQNMFSAVPNFNIEVPSFKEPPFTKENLGNFWKIMPIRDKDQLDFIWILDNLAQHYKNHPASYISHLIGNEGPNSLLSYLIDEGLATELSSGFNTEMSLFTKLSISIQLTKKGVQNYERVCKIVFEYLKMLRHKGAEQRIFEEIQKILKVGFHFKDKEQPMNYVMSLADRMHYYPTEDIIRLNYLMEEYNAELINSVINSLTADNMRVYLVSKVVEKECNQTEKWYGTKYNVEPFSKQFREMFENPHVGPSRTGKVLDLPPPNLFIPEHFDLYAKDLASLPKYPQKIHETEKMEVFHKQDNTFKQPKASMYVKIYSNDLGFGSNSKTFLLLDFWVKLFNESIREMLDQAGAASVGVSVSLDAEGTEVVISGFNDSLLKVSAVLFDKMRTFNPMVLKEQYESIYESTVKNVKNFYKNQPYQQGMTFQNANMQKSSENFLPEEELHLLQELTFKDLLDFHANWFKTIRLESMFIGNITKEQSIEISTNIENILSSMRERTFTLSKDDTPEVRVIRLQKEKIWFYEHENLAKGQERQESNSALISLFQYEQESPFTRVLMSILGNYLREPCFDRLRTDEQLGYIVSGFNANMRGVLNYVILVQSNIKPPQYLSQRVLAFLDSMRERIKSITQEEFDKYVESIRVKISQKDLSIRQEGSKYWHEITTHKYVFDRREKDLEQLDKIKKEDLLWIFEEVFFKNRRLFETHVISQNHIEENNAIKAERLKGEKNTSQVKSTAWFKRRLPLYPDFNSML